MTIVEKLKAEEGNFLSITIYRDRGLFVHAYERSAFALCLEVKAFQTKVNYNSVLKMKYISVGVPVNSIEKYISKYKFKTDELEENLKVYYIQLPLPLFSEEEFQKWKKEIIVADFDKNTRNGQSKPAIIDCGKVGEKKEDESGNASPAVSPQTPASVAPEDKGQSKTDAFGDIIDDILAVQIQDFSPMMALNYLSELQNKLRDAKRRNG